MTAPLGHDLQKLHDLHKHTWHEIDWSDKNIHACRCRCGHTYMSKSVLFAGVVISELACWSCSSHFNANDMYAIGVDLAYVPEKQ